MRRFALGVTFLVAALGGACQPDEIVTTTIAVDASGSSSRGVLSPESATDAVIGEPIVIDDTTPLLRWYSPYWRRRTHPAGALGDRIVTFEVTSERRTGDDNDIRLATWNPADGTRRPIPRWRTDSEIRNDILGGAGDWLALTHEPNSANHLDILVLNVKTGESEIIVTPAQRDLVGRPVGADGYVAWGERAYPSVRTIHIYDIRRRTLLALTITASGGEPLGASPVVTGGGVAAWSTARAGGAANRIYLYEMEAERLSWFALPVGTWADAEGISANGRYLAWSVGEQQYVTDLATDVTTRYALAGRVFAGPTHAAYGEEPENTRETNAAVRAARSARDGGVYAYDTGEARPMGLQAGCICIAAGVLGEWFMWLDIKPLSEAAREFTEPIVDRDFRFLRLRQ